MRPSPVDPRLDQPPTSDLKARALIAAIPDPIFRIGTDGVYRGFKVDSEADLLTSPDDVLGRSIYERLPQDVADAVLAAGRRAVAENTLQNIQYTLDVRGEVREYEGRAVASGDDEFVLIVRDFTDIARQARALESERDFSRAVVRSTPSFLALVDEEGVLLGVNHALERAAGIPESAWVGAPFWTRFIAAEDVERAKEDFLRFHAGDPPGIVEYEHDAPDGGRLVVDGPRRPSRTPKVAPSTFSAASTSRPARTSKRRSGGRGRASSPRATPSGSASSGTCTTARSRTSSPSPTPSTSRRARCAPTPMRPRTTSSAHSSSSTPRTRSCASSRAGSTRRSSPSAGSPRRCGRSRAGRRSLSPRARSSRRRRTSPTPSGSRPPPRGSARRCAATTSPSWRPRGSSCSSAGTDLAGTTRWRRRRRAAADRRAREPGRFRCARGDAARPRRRSGRGPQPRRAPGSRRAGDPRRRVDDDREGDRARRAGAGDPRARRGGAAGARHLRRDDPLRSRAPRVGRRELSAQRLRAPDRELRGRPRAPRDRPRATAGRVHPRPLGRARRRRRRGARRGRRAPRGGAHRSVPAVRVSSRAHGGLARARTLDGDGNRGPPPARQAGAEEGVR